MRKGKKLELVSCKKSYKASYKLVLCKNEGPHNGDCGICGQPVDPVLDYAIFDPDLLLSKQPVCDKCVDAVDPVLLRLRDIYLKAAGMVIKEAQNDPYQHYKPAVIDALTQFSGRDYKHLEALPDPFHWSYCPVCRRGDRQYLNIRKDHWGYCEVCIIKWHIGTNLFSSWQEETPEVWRRNKKFLEEYGRLSDDDEMASFQGARRFGHPRT
ncbi:MAG: hypothetical protein AB1500_07710 [Bacillota bacterium]